MRASVTAQTIDSVMPSLIDRAPAALQTEHGRRLVKFATVSLISTAVSQGILFLTYHVTRSPP